MRGVLILLMFLLVPSLASADVISVHTDATASSCHLAVGFSTTATVMHQFTPGATASRFKLEFPPGSSFFAFVTPFPVLGSIVSDGTVQYGQCIQGSYPIGTITAILTQGQLWTRPADGYANIWVADCQGGEKTATCGSAVVGGDGFSYCQYCIAVATQQSTWGAVKSLYR